MVIKILLIISILLQLSAVSVAVGLMRKTKYNLSWILFTIGLFGLAFTRFGEYFQITRMQALRLPDEFFVWLGIITSICFAGGVFLVQKIFKYISRVERQRRISERRILNTVLRTEEKERQRFSKDLHDGLGPLLSSARMSLSALSTPELDHRSQEILRNTNYVINEAIRSLREISANLSPHILNDFGLARAVSNFINKLPGEGIRIRYDTNLKGERFDMDIEVILYRVVCELINNSIKHAHASNISVSMHRNDGHIRIFYQDDGKGFDPDEAARRGMGISNMTSRISSLKGEIEISSSPGAGMSATIDIRI